MKNLFFKENNTIILKHIKINWKLLIFLTIFWTIVCMTLMLFTLIIHVDGVSPPMIGNYDIEVSNNTYTTGDEITSISKMLNWVIFSGPSLIFFSIVSLVIMNMIIGNELNTGKILFWSTSPISRTQIIFSKTIYIYIVNLIIISPTIIIILIFSGISYDVNLYIGNVILYMVEFLIFLFLLNYIYSYIFVCLSEKNALANSLISLITFWILITWIALLISNEMPASLTKTILNFIKYISIQSLIINSLSFSKTNMAKPIIFENNIGTVTINPYKFENYNKLFATVFPIINISIGFLLMFSTIYNFKTKDLRI